MKIKARQGYEYTLYAERCDKCKAQSKAVSENFGALNAMNRKNGWKITYEDGKWKGYCPECKE